MVTSKMPKGTEREKVKWLTDMLTERDQEIEGLEKRLEGSFETVKKADDLLLKERVAWKDEKHELVEKIKRLEEEVKHERRRATQALDVAESTSDAAGGIGRLLRTLVDDNVLEQLRLANHDREQKYRDSMRHRRPG